MDLWQLHSLWRNWRQGSLQVSNSNLRIWRWPRIISQLQLFPRPVVLYHHQLAPSRAKPRIVLLQEVDGSVQFESDANICNASISIGAITEYHRRLVLLRAGSTVPQVTTKLKAQRHLSSLHSRPKAFQERRLFKASCSSWWWVGVCAEMLLLLGSWHYNYGASHVFLTEYVPKVIAKWCGAYTDNFARTQSTPMWCGTKPQSEI